MNKQNLANLLNHLADVYEKNPQVWSRYDMFRDSAKRPCNHDSGDLASYCVFGGMVIHGPGFGIADDEDPDGGPLWTTLDNATLAITETLPIIEKGNSQCNSNNLLAIGAWNDSHQTVQQIIPKLRKIAEELCSANSTPNPE